jgi:N-glycosylase/DNA lyase
VEELIGIYRERREEIRKRLEEFRLTLNGSEEDVFSELCFCLCTPQSSARVCDVAVRGLVNSGALFRGGSGDLERGLGSVRFRNNKAGYIVKARVLFERDGRLDIKSRLRGEAFQVREWLAKNVKGMGYKEASHFLRNIGLGEGLAILDRHILKNLVKYGVVDEVPKSLTRKRYLEIETRMREFSIGIGIPLGELDLLFWSKETGEVFK